MKKLYRSNQDKFLGGVLGGFAEYVNKDATLVRLAYILITLIFNLPGVLFYIICWVVIPKKPIHVSHETNTDNVSRETNTDHNDFDVPHETSEAQTNTKQEAVSE